MNRRIFFLCLFPILVVVAFGPVMTTVTGARGPSRVLVSADPLRESLATIEHFAATTAPVEPQYQWTRGTTSPNVMASEGLGTALVGSTWGTSESPSAAIDSLRSGPIRRSVDSYNVERVVVVMFNSDTTSSETRTFDGQTWTLHRVPGPPPRTMPATVYDAARKQIVFFGNGRASFPRGSLSAPGTMTDDWDSSSGRW